MQPIVALFMSILCMFHAGAPAGTAPRPAAGRAIARDQAARPCDLVRLPPALSALKELKPDALLRRACPAPYRRHLARVEVSDDLRNVKWRCRF